jgi:hypothetical protein
MTVIAVRRGIMASDSRGTDDSQSYVYSCGKIFRKAEALIGLAGDDGPGVVFLDWYGSGKPKPEILVTGEGDFEALVMTREAVMRFDRWCRGDRWTGKFFAIGSGAAAALGAMHSGATARQAAAIACKIDPFCAGPIRSMSL